MARFTVRLDDDGALAEWVEAEAEERDRSKAWVVRQAIAAAAGEESVYTDAHRTDAHHTDADRTDTGELRERVESLEAAVYDDNDGERADSPTDADATPTPHADETRLQDVMPAGSGEERVAAAVESVADSWSDTEARLAQRIAAATAVLSHAVRTGDAVGKSDAIDEFHEEHAIEDQSEETWWRKNVRPVLKEYGEYSQGKHGYVVDTDALPTPKS